jgi:hypothetical protein
VARAGIVTISSALLQHAIELTGLAQAFGDRLVRAQGLLGAAPVQDDGALLEHLARQLERKPRLAGARLAGEQDEPPRVVDPHARPRRAQPAQLGHAADERNPRQPRDGGGRPAGPGASAALIAATSSRVAAEGAMPSAVRRRSARWS